VNPARFAAAAALLACSSLVIGAQDRDRSPTPQYLGSASCRNCTTCHTDKSNRWASETLKTWPEFSPWRIGELENWRIGE
jgi:hypothetical protein